MKHQTRPEFLPFAVCLLPFAFSILGCQFQPMRTPLSMNELRTNQTTLQSHEFTCGAAALATVLSSLGEPITEQDVLVKIFGETMPVRINEKGEAEVPPLTAADLQRGARNAGFKVVSLQAADGGEALDALEKLRPIICRIFLYEDFLHFVVVRGVENGWVSLSDPAYGNVRVTIPQFDKVWKAGDRILLAVSKEPFLAWKTDSGQVFIKRDESETVPVVEGVSPVSLYSSSLRSITEMNTKFGKDVNADF